MIHAPQRLGIFRPWPEGIAESEVFRQAIEKVNRSGLPTWVHAHTLEQPCNARCQSISVAGTGNYEELFTPAFKV